MENTFKAYLDNQTLIAHDKLTQLFDWIDQTYPQLVKVIKWNQPMYTHHETFIIGFSVSKKHMAISPEPYLMELFKNEIELAGYSSTSNLFRIKWDQEVDLGLMKKLIDFQIVDKKEFKGFWR